MAIMEQESVRLSNEGIHSKIVINRPQNLNALNPDVLQGLILALDKLVRRGDVRTLIITGEGEKSFVAGADIAGMSQLGPRAIADYVELGQRAMRAIEKAPFPVIAAINGYALGGGLELALACDLIIAVENAKLGQPEVNLGIIPGFGGTQRLIQRCGIGVARRLCYTGEMLEASEAHKLGIVDMLCASAGLSETCNKVAKSIEEKAPLAVQRVKDVIRQSQETLLLSGLRLEVEGFLDLFNTADREEGMNAFMQKRPAKFIGR